MNFNVHFTRERENKDYLHVVASVVTVVDAAKITVQ